MMMLITYDVDFSDKSGASRLRKVAKICTNYGVRVQNSVFEMFIDPAQLVAIKNQLSKVIDPTKDSVRFYNLGNNGENRVGFMGIDDSVHQRDTLIL